MAITGLDSPKYVDFPMINSQGKEFGLFTSVKIFRKEGGWKICSFRVHPLLTKTTATGAKGVHGDKHKHKNCNLERMETMASGEIRRGLGKGVEI